MDNRPRPNFKKYEPAGAVRRPVHPEHGSPQAATVATAAHPIKKSQVRKPVVSGNKRLRYLLAAIVIGLFAWLANGYITTRNQLEQAKNGGGAGQNEAQQLVSKIGQLVQLPQGETPTIATVNNASKLQKQAFFKNAQNGDKVLIYSKSGQAVLYRPSTNKVIEYSTVNLTGT